jgi:hypothetical protein
MSRGQNSDLRSAMKNLQVNVPMKLKGRPTFEPPSPPRENAKEAPQSEVPPSQATRLETIKSGEAHFEPSLFKTAQIEIPQKESSQFEKSTQVESFGRIPRAASQNEAACIEVPPIGRHQLEQPQIEASKNEAAQIETKPRDEVTQSEVPTNGISQNEPPHNGEAGNELPQTKDAQIEVADFLPTGGFFKLSHNIFQEPIVRKLSGDCFRLFLWLSARAWRYPTSGGEIRASVRFMENHTGMGHATISRSLKTLKEIGLLTLLETDFKQGNLWLVSSLACGGTRGPEDLPPRSEVPRNEQPQKNSAGASKREGSSLKTRGELPQNECNIRSIKKTKNLSEAQSEKDASLQAETTSFSIEVAVQRFEENVDLNVRKQMILERIERDSNNSFRVPESIAKKLVACDWFKTNPDRALKFAI